MKTKEQILEKYYSQNVGLNTFKFNQVIEAMQEYKNQSNKEECLDFGLFLENLEPINKITVHPPAGSGSGTGLYYKTIEQLYNEYKKIKP